MKNKTIIFCTNCHTKFEINKEHLPQKVITDEKKGVYYVYLVYCPYCKITMELEIIKGAEQCQNVG